MILFCGDLQKQYYIEEVATELNEEVRGIEKNVFHIQEIVEPVLSDDYDIVVVNVDSLIDTPQTLYDTIEDLRIQTNSKFVFMYLGTTADSTVVDFMARRGYDCWIVAVSLGEAKLQASQALRGRPTIVVRGPIEEDDEQPILQPVYDSDDAPETEHKQRIICFAGANRRIGTTTNCVQAAKLLQTFNKSVAVVEANRTRYVEALVDAYGLPYEDRELGHVMMQGVELFRYGVTHKDLPAYDYVIYDCGSMLDKDFPKALFMNCETRILVFGSKPNEGRNLAKAFTKFPNTHFIVTLAPEHHKNELSEMFPEHLYFAPLMLDPFETFEEGEIMYAKILRKEEQRKRLLREKMRTKQEHTDAMLSRRRKRKKAKNNRLVG